MSMNLNSIWVAISTIRLKLNDDTEYAPATNNLYSPIVGFMKTCTGSKNNRMGMLRTITGIHQLSSTKQLTAYACGTLIEEWKSDDSWKPSAEATEFLEALAGYVERQPSFEQRENDYLGWLEQYHMSDM